MGRARVVVVVVLLLAGAWAALGIHRIDPEREFAVVDGERSVRGAVFVPRGVSTLRRFPKGPFDVPLPGADSAGLTGPGGLRFGLRGSATLRWSEARWREAAATPSAKAALAEAVRETGAPLYALRQSPGEAPRLARSFTEDLRRALAGRGLDLDAVHLDSLDLATVAADASIPLVPRHVLVVGLDGADWAILDPLLAAGKLPHLEALLDRGVRARLLSISPMISPVVWTTVATGLPPTRHGILDFLAPSETSREGAPVTSDLRRAPALWNLLSDAGGTVGVTGWWATWPAEKVRGWVITDRVAYQLFGYRSDPGATEGKTWPGELWSDVRPLVRDPASVGWDELLPYLSGPRRRPAEFTPDERELLDEFRTLLASGRTYRDAALAARRKLGPGNLEIVYFEGTDTVGHLFMPYRPPRLPRIDARRFASFSSIVDRYYETVDGYLGDLLEGLGPDWTIVVLSDHGFVTDASRPVTTDSRIGHGAAADWHRRFGVLVLSGAGIRRGAKLDEATVYDVAPTLLALFGQPVPEDWPGRVLDEALEPSLLAAHPVRLRAVSGAGGTAAAATPRPVDADAEALRSKLESLGYLGGGRTADTTLYSTANNRGVALLAAGKAAEAEAAFREAASLAPDRRVILVNLGNALHAQGKDDEALKVLAEAMEAPEGKRAAGIQIAQILLTRREYPRAEEVLREVLRDEPDASDVRNLLGVVLDREGSAAAAEREWTEAARLDSQAAEPRNNLGNLARRRGDLTSAERWYQGAIDADPYFMGAYNNLALVYQDRGEPERAADLYGKALVKAPSNAIVLNNLASLRYAMGQVDEARRLWKEASEADPAYVSPLNNLAGILIGERRLDEAEALLRRALAREPGYGDARINLALVLRGRGKLDAAEAELRTAVEDPRARATACLQLGLLELGRGAADEAATWFTRSVEAAPRRVEGWNALGETERRRGRVEAARVAWERSLAIDGRQQEIREALEDLK